MPEEGTIEDGAKDDTVPQASTPKSCFACDNFSYNDGSKSGSGKRTRTAPVATFLLKEDGVDSVGEAVAAVV